MEESLSELDYDADEECDSLAHQEKRVRKNERQRELKDVKECE